MKEWFTSIDYLCKNIQNSQDVDWSNAVKNVHKEFYKKSWVFFYDCIGRGSDMWAILE